jgi:hypothetical protein
MTEASHVEKQPEHVAASQHTIDEPTRGPVGGASTRRAPPHLLTPQTVRYLQRTAGNRAVQRLLQSQSAQITPHPEPKPIIQPRLHVGPADDEYEQEAENIARSVQRAVASPKSSEMLRRKDNIATARSDEIQGAAAPPVAQSLSDGARKFDRPPQVTKALTSSDSIQRLLLPEAERAFNTAAKYNPRYVRGKRITDHHVYTISTPTESGSPIITEHDETNADNVTADEQKKLMDLGSGQSLFGRLILSVLSC